MEVLCGALGGITVDKVTSAIAWEASKVSQATYLA